MTEPQGDSMIFPSTDAAAAAAPPPPPAAGANTGMYQTEYIDQRR